MKPIRSSVLALLLLSACGGNPFLPDDTTAPPTVPGPGTPDTGGITTDGGLPPGTSTPTAKTGILRYEPKGTASIDGDSGNGYARTVSYNSVDDTFSVDNLGFDGNNVFARVQPASLNPNYLGDYAIYDGKMSYPDSVTGTQIEQLQHRAIYGVSSDGAVSFAIVRTGSYSDYGFGGFIYQRSGGVTLPTEGVGAAADAENPNYRGQAHFEGTTSGLRDFKSRGGMEMTTGDMFVDIDYDDFNDGNAVKGVISNRRVYDLSGNDITQDIVDALTVDSGVSQLGLPGIVFRIGPGVMNDNGEIVGTLSSSYLDSSGSLQKLDDGKYYALVSGAGADQKVVGVYVVESDDKRYEGVTARETSGFILVRK